MATWILIFFGVLLLGHISGVVLGPWWKKWILKMMGFPKEVQEFFLMFLRASIDFKWTKEEKGQLKKEFDDIVDVLAPPKKL
jgi:hypothetical protein